MKRNDDYLRPRQCFLPVIDELEIAQDLIDQAGTAILIGDLKMAGNLLVQADMPEIGKYAQLIAGPNNDDVHRCRYVPGEPPIRKDKTRQRMPSKKIEDEIFERDGWHCRFCNIRIISRKAVSRLNELFPDQVRWQAKREIEKHPALRAMCSSLDHIVPHSRGGNNDPTNLVATCNPCQFGRNRWTIKEVGLLDPRGREPIRDGWDGLLRIVDVKNS